MMSRALARTALALAMLIGPPILAEPVDETALSNLIGDWDRFAEIEAMGRDVLPALASLYEATPDPARRSQIANVFYRLGWESPDAKRVLIADVHTQDVNLRLAVQWALGRVSGDDDVVPVLLEIMREDPNPLFRDKAACALASDQIHIDPAHRLRLFEGLVAGLDDPKPDVRNISIKALRIHTGQTQGFSANAPHEQRAQAIARWRRWLDEYRANL